MIINRGNLQTIYRGYSAAFQDGFGQAATDEALLAMAASSDSREQEYAWLGQWPGLKEWVGERVLRGIVQHGYTIRNRKFEASIEVRRDDIEDDHYGIYGPLFREAGRASAIHPTQLIYEALADGFSTVCYDGQYFFDTDHSVAGASVSNTGGGTGTAWFLCDLSRTMKPVIMQRRSMYELTRMDDMSDEGVFLRDVYRYGIRGRCNVGYGLWQLAFGSKQTLNAANYAAARKALWEMNGDEGRRMGVMPTHLIVPPSLEGAARELLNAERTTGGATNIWMGSATMHMTPWLS